MTLKRNTKGFTIVELLIVIVVIGILAALVITTFAGIQQRARDTERETDVKSIHGHLETFFADNGYYPALADLNSATWRDTNMRGLDDEALVPPNSTETTLAASPAGSGTTEQYGYAATSGGSACATTAGTQCDGYTLEADVEGSTTNYSKSALN